MKDMDQYFINPIIPAQKQYEAVRAVVIDKLSAEEVATKFNYSINIIYSLLRDIR